MKVNDSATQKIKSIHYRRILNSHVEFTPEFIVELENGSMGIGAPPKGETTSIYEDKTDTFHPEKIIQIMKKDQYLDIPLTQKILDDYLQQKFKIFGRNNSYAISLAFYNASRKSQSRYPSTKSESIFPNICMNILNGGNYAYTNPVLSDFPEFLLVPKHSKLDELINDHNLIQKKIREQLTNKEKVIINGNLVNKFKTKDNRECLDFLLEILESLKLSHKYDLMIDASAGDLWSDGSYKFFLTDNSLKTSEKLCEYWMELIKDYKLKFLEDPFHEKDINGWKNLTASQSICDIISDNFYSSDSQRIMEGAHKKYTHGTIVKPNQAGTATATMQAIETAQSNNQIVITSHRSISTESIFLSEITTMYQVKYIKIGPLSTDYSSIIRLNELIRLTGVGYE